ncbi:MAG: response regulator transcription factor [Verrucomicrobia bacterium]|nr:response regulator transcription factor [Verrucomicrobiota bacterium]
MKRIRTLIADDEPLAREGIATMLRTDPEVEVVGQCADGQSTVEAIRQLRPDLVYLDVQMPRGSGFEALRQLQPAEIPEVIFVTAYDQYAVQAFESGATDYLVKPFRDQRFQEALRRAKRRVRNRDEEANSAATERRARIAFKVAGEYLLVTPPELIAVEARGDFVLIQVGAKVHRVRETLQEVERRLDAKQFVRIHRSYIVNLDHVSRIAPTLYGDYTVVLSNGAKVRLSRSYRSALGRLLPGH